MTPRTALVATLAASLLATPALADAPAEAPAATAAPDATVKAKEKPGLGLPVGGSVGLTTSLGRGTFNGGADRQAYLGASLSLRPRVTLPGDLGMSLALRLDVDAELVDSAYSFSTERQQVFLSDLLLTYTWADFVKVEPAGLGLSGSFGLTFPTSLLSQHASKILGFRLGLTAEWAPLGWLSVTYSASGTRNINRYDTAVLDDDDFGAARLRRPGGSESVTSGLTATGAGVTAWALGNDLEVGFTFLDDFSFTIGFGLLTVWSEKRIPKDQWSSPYAVGGTGRADLMTGSLALGWEPLDVLAVELGTVVEQAPKTEDNERFRFPFWDTTNGALNRQLFYLDVTLTL
ncbi:MAG: hypothetical protein EP329_00900 [Deltaproteobacteria bacterium]|nr:MAG: hypothetical protein EP329_00900 [Deltaproteobacteria bacterium]